jgi:hypothetical protein
LKIVNITECKTRQVFSGKTQTPFLLDRKEIPPFGGKKRRGFGYGEAVFFNCHAF